MTASNKSRSRGLPPRRDRSTYVARRAGQPAADTCFSDTWRDIKNFPWDHAWIGPMLMLWVTVGSTGRPYVRFDGARVGRPSQDREIPFLTGNQPFHSH